MLHWEKLLCARRRKDSSAKRISLGTAVGRKATERDYDRILFAAPTRRLADKTQVFPMEEHDSVRTRLAHSHEVSNLARSIGIRLAFEHAEAVFGKNYKKLEVERVVPSLLAAVGLAHDLGNPPFGHQGEASMQQYFRTKELERQCELSRKKGERSESAKISVPIDIDFLEFDGNAQTFRLVTRLQVLNDDYGLNLAMGTLAALVKYPAIYGSNKNGYKKFGIFRSESEIIQEVWHYTGLKAGLRHPLALVMEACDDIAYSIIDAEDTVKKGYASFYDLMDFIETETKDKVSKSVVKKARERNRTFKKSGLSSRELNDVSMQVFRALAISKMIEAATSTFVRGIKGIMSGQADPSFELIKASNCGLLCAAAKKFDIRYGFRQREVLKLELRGNNHIRSMMEILDGSIAKVDRNDFPFEKFVYGSISENYRRIFESSDMLDYSRRQLVCDAVSGMTESYLIKKHAELCALM